MLLRSGASSLTFACPAVLLLALAACHKSDDKPAPPPPEAGYIVVRPQQVALTVELPGRTAAYETSDVRPQVSGVIKARLFEEGSLVRKGQPLYQIDPSLYRAAVSQAQANLQSAQAARESASARAQRFRPLAQMQAVAEQDYVDANATAKQSVATVAQNRAALETARINLAFTTVPAPISGRIGRSLFTTGALVTSAQVDPLTSIQRLDPIFVDIQQSSADLLALRRQLSQSGVTPSSARVTLRLEDGTDYRASGTMQFAEAVVDPATGAVTLRARFPNPRGLLLPGMFVRAMLSQATTANGILVPQAAITRDPQGNGKVMLVGPGNKPVERQVTTTQTVGVNWLVTKGLQAGDKVIVEGLGRIKAGEAIRPVPAGSPARPAPQSPGTSKGAGGASSSSGS